jgi:hypothetical protein
VAASNAGQRYDKPHTIRPSSSFSLNYITSRHTRTYEYPDDVALKRHPPIDQQPFTRMPVRCHSLSFVGSLHCCYDTRLDSICTAWLLGRADLVKGHGKRCLYNRCSCSRDVAVPKENLGYEHSLVFDLLGVNLGSLVVLTELLSVIRGDAELRSKFHSHFLQILDTNSTSLAVSGVLGGILGWRQNCLQPAAPSLQPFSTRHLQVPSLKVTYVTRRDDLSGLCFPKWAEAQHTLIPWTNIQRSCLSAIST